MSMTDPISDLLTRIRNAQQSSHSTCLAPASKVKERICSILKDEGYIVGYHRVAQKPQDSIEITLKYGPDRRGAIVGIQRVSRPGQRVYVGADSIPKVRNGLGVAIVSTSKGLVADHVARRNRVGGELICTVW